jgi:subtilisin-like proprotein convertase family protein
LEPRLVPAGIKDGVVAPLVLSAPAMPGLAELDSQIAAAVRRAWQVSPGTQTARWIITLSAGASTTGLTNLGATLTPVQYWANSYLVEFGQPKDVAGFPTTLDAVGGAAWYYPLIARQQTPRMTNDPQVTSQWHLKNTGQGGGTVGADANVEPVWNAGINGSGATIAIVDDGLLRTHVDLIGNYDGANSFDFNDFDSDPMPLSFDTHGTSAAGVAAAQGDNGIGVAGAAYEANLAGIRLIAGPTDDFTEAQALSYHKNAIDIYSNSWGPADNGVQAGPGPMLLAAFADNFNSGRLGKGTIYTWAAGNGLEADDNVNYDGYANNRHVIAVGAITNRGTQAYYSEPGAAMLVTAYSNGGTRGITTTSGPGTSAYTNSFGGTSSATPLVSGVIGLMLDANPNLTARDVQHILVQSADKVNPGDAGWTTNGAGLPVNHKYGFGGINAQAAVALTQGWTSVGPEVAVSTGFQSVGLSIPDGVAANTYGSPVSDQVTVGPDFRIEHVEVEFSATHPYRGDLEVVLTSPDGTQSVLSQVHSDPGANYSGWTFTSVRHWGEMSAGTWTLRVRDGYNGDTGTFAGWKLNLYGTDAPQAPILAKVESTPLRYLENQATPVSPGITVSDLDSPTLSGATIAITAGFNAAEDQLLFTNQNGISGSYAAGTGVLTLTGDATLSQYQAALRSVQYQNLSEYPAAVTRTVRFSAVDPGGLVSNTPSRAINVVAVNDAPTFSIGPDIVILQDSGPQTYDPWATDISVGPPAEAGQSITGATATVLSGGNLFSQAPTVTADGTLSFTTGPGKNGTATVEVRFRDNGGTADGGVDTSAPQTFVITITPRPTVVPDRFNTDEDVPLVVAGLGLAENDISPDGLPLTATLVDPPAHGDLVLNSDGSFTYTPNQHYHGTDSFTYIVGDGNLDSVPGPVTITVRSVNDVPVAGDDAFSTPGGRPLFLSPLANDTDADADGLTLVTYTTPAHGRLTRTGSGLQYTPTPGYQGPDVFTYTASDGKGGSDTGSVTLAVTDATPPKIVGVRARYGPGGSRTLDLATLSRGALPWDSVSRIEITFSEAVALAGSALTLTGPGGDVPLTFTLSADGRTGIWTVLGAGLTAGRYTVRLSAAGVTDLSPNANPLARDYARTFAVLPGDFDGNGVVNAKDVSGIKKKFTTNPAKVSLWADLNADGVVDQADLAVAVGRLNTRLS